MSSTQQSSKLKDSVENSSSVIRTMEAKSFDPSSYNRLAISHIQGIGSSTISSLSEATISSFNELSQGEDKSILNKKIRIQKNTVGNKLYHTLKFTGVKIKLPLSF
jgi:hypothetical protein